MNIGILSKRTTHFTGKMKEFYENKGFNVNIYTAENLVINETLFRNDFYILKSKSRFFLYAGFFLDANQIPVIPNPHISSIHKNRILSHYLIEKAGLLAPKFYYSTTETLKSQIDKVVFPLILKPVVGSGSKGVKIIMSLQDLKNDDKKVVYLEKFIKGTHYIVYFIKDKICTLIKPPLSNEHAEMEKIKTPKDIEELIKTWRKYLSNNSLFGHLDIVREESSNKLYVVDPGSFPEFSNWKCNGSPVEIICNLILKQVDKLKKN